MNKEILNVCEDNNWTVTEHINGNIIECDLQSYSDEGQDFHIEFNYDSNQSLEDELNDIINNIEERIESFDVSYETYLWLDSTGHGINGAPYDMKDIYEDMESCLNMMKDLVEELRKIEY